MQVEYIASGLSFTRITEPSFTNIDGCTHAVNKLIDKMRDDGTVISALFNAYTEAKFGPRLQEHYRAFNNVFADSGGLQVVTLGKQIDDSLKNDIYGIQGQYSSVAMSFDEIPVRTTKEGGSKRGDNSSRLFDYDMIEPCAKKSGQNLDQQIEAFKAMGSGSKPMLIAQGNCRHTIAQWVDIVYKEVKPENRKHIHGIAFAFSSLGPGMLEAVETCAAYGLIEHEDIKKNIHLLGVGALKKLVPYIECFKSGFFDPDTNLSIDSTSHSQSVVMGFFQDEDLVVRRIGKYPNAFNRRYLQKVYDAVEGITDTGTTFETFYDYAIRNISTSKHLKEEHEASMMANLLYPVSTFLQANNLVKAIRDCHDNEGAYGKYLNKKLTDRLGPVTLLSEVRTNQQMEQWFSRYAKYVQSERIKNNKVPTITLFD